MLFADEIYDRLVLDDLAHHAAAALAPDLPVFTMNGLSKSHNICGFRSGWMVISGRPGRQTRDWHRRPSTCWPTMRLCANVPGQHAIQTALGGYQSINDLVKPGGRLCRQRDLAYELITAIPGVTCVKPQAALYMFPRLDPEMYPIADDRQFFMEVLRATRVMLVQGSGFNYPDNQHFRIVFCPTRTTCARPSAGWRASGRLTDSATPRRLELIFFF